jgi:hypothetical protein
MRTLLLDAFLLLASTAFNSPVRAGPANDGDRIVGTWKLVSVVHEDAQTGERTSVLGAHPRGYQIVTAGGRWLALVTAQGRKVPQTDQERATALRTMISYTGKYRLKDGKVITKIEAAWNEAWVDTEQVRAYRFEGDRLYLESPPQPHPNIGGRVVRIIATWDREN